MTDVSTLSLILTLVVALIIGTMKWFERKYGNNPEAWDLNKFLQLLLVAAVIMVAEFFYGNAIQFPAEDILTAGMALFGVAYTLITGGKIAKNVITGAQPKTPVSSQWSAGFVVTPSFSKGVSAFVQHFHITAGAPAADHPGAVEVEIDWMDGTPKELLKLINGFVEVDHEFRYEQGSSKYTGHSFYPEFTIILNDATRQSFNTDGKCCEIEVQTN